MTRFYEIACKLLTLDQAKARIIDQIKAWQNPSDILQLYRWACDPHALLDTDEDDEIVIETEVVRNRDTNYEIVKWIREGGVVGDD